MKITRFIPLIVFAVLVGFFWRGLSLDPQNLPSARIGKLLPPFQVPLLGDDREYLTTAKLQGHIALINVWASWCSSCADEQLFLSKLAQQGVAIYGLNYKDNAHDAKQWLSEWGNPYKLIGEDREGKVAIELGVYGTPETFLIDKNGMIRYRYAGILDAKVWEQDFIPRIKELEHAA